ncbi:MAG: hypothetical protein KUG79_12685 [Pseudomonadales bacterium]|nr:hypothetical protein [Pseudomonadales bacterium]
MKPANIILDLLRTYRNRGASAKIIMSTGRMFGFNENQMRVSLSRLVAKNTLDNFKRGYYRLTLNTNPINEFIEQWRLGEKRRREWTNNEWACVVLPPTTVRKTASKKSTRDSDLKTNKSHWALFNNGFRRITENLLVRPDNLIDTGSHLTNKLRALGLTADAVVITRAQMDTSSQSAWLNQFNILQLEQAYSCMEQQIKASQQGLYHQSVQQAQQESFHLGGEAIQLLVKDPLLPEEYQPPAAREALWQAMLEYDAAGRDIWSGPQHAAYHERPDIIPTRNFLVDQWPLPS